MTKALLTINNLTIRFSKQEKPVVEGVNFRLNKGESIGIVGESGSGKSLTCLAILGILPKSAQVEQGEILFSEDSKDLLKLNQKQLQNIRGNRIGMIFQEPMTALNPVFTCGDQVDEILKAHTSLNKKERNARVLELFQEVLLPEPEEVLKKYPHQLSGGQRQRVMIAMAIANNPQLLIADEPTTALDVTVQKHILDLLKKLQRKYEMALIFISHDLGVIKHITDRALVMYRGEVVEQGLTSDLLTHPEHPYTKGLISCKPPIDKRLVSLPVINDFLYGRGQETQEVTSKRRAEIHQQMYRAEPILEVKNLNIWYPRSSNLFGTAKEYFKAVQDVSFQVYKGETLGLVGESGCGKTTVGRTLMQLIQEKAGDIRFQNESITHLNPKDLRSVRRKIQLIFQDPYSSLNPRLTIGQIIFETMQVHKICKNNRERKERVIDLLEQTGLSAEHYNRYPHEFSGGQRQRIGIARALALEPELIICDESVSALDVSVQAQVLNLLNDLKAKYKLTYIFISHDLSVVKYMSDRILVMNQGKLEELNEADELYENPQSTYTKKLISAILE